MLRKEPDTKYGGTRIVSESGRHVLTWTEETDPVKIDKWLDEANAAGLERASDELDEHLDKYTIIKPGTKEYRDRVFLSNVKDRMLNKLEKKVFGRIQH